MRFGTNYNDTLNSLYLELFSLLAEAPFPLYSLSLRTGRKGTSAMGRNELC